jgi:sterol desaturase/sphingolipid hydroxylase (fatty acid hydroxylase superfamily)
VLLTGSLTGIFSGVVGAFYPGQSLTWVLAGQNGLMCLLLVLGLNLQHSHVQLRYPRVLRDIFVSPAYHQVHHSRSKRHYNLKDPALRRRIEALLGSAHLTEKLVNGLAKTL